MRWVVVMSKFLVAQKEEKKNSLWEIITRLLPTSQKKKQDATMRWIVVMNKFLVGQKKEKDNSLWKIITELLPLENEMQLEFERRRTKTRGSETIRNDNVQSAIRKAEVNAGNTKNDMVEEGGALPAEPDEDFDKSSKDKKPKDNNGKKIGQGSGLGPVLNKRNMATDLKTQRVGDRKLGEGTSLIAQLLGRKKRRLAANLWTRAMGGAEPIKYSFDLSSTWSDQAFAEEKITKALNLISSLTCLKFQLSRGVITGPYILFKSSTSSCKARIGQLSGANVIEMVHGGGITCFAEGIIVHEVMHALGHFHEQSRSDRDDYITILYDNIKPGYESEYKKVSNTNNLEPYDYESIMHYSQKVFAVTGTRTFITKPSGMFDFLVGQRLQLSFYDVKTINEGYQCTANCPNNCQNHGYSSAIDGQCKCSCPSYLKGDDCGSVDSDPDCGGIHTFSGVGDTFNITIESTPEDEPRKCVYLLKGPDDSIINLHNVDFDMGIENHVAQPINTVEIRHNMLPQMGIIYGARTLLEDLNTLKQFSENLMMLIYQEGATSKSGPAIAKFVARATTKEDKCLSNPCFGSATCVPDLVNDNFTCICPRNYYGRICTELDQNKLLTDDFESSALGFMMNVDGDDTDWIRRSGDTPTYNSGPSSGYLSATYLYVEASSPTSNGDSAILSTTCDFSLKKGRCFAFCYHVYGSKTSMALLRVVFYYTNDTNYEALNIQENIGNEWRCSKLQIDSTSDDVNVTIMIEYTRRRSFQADIAVDNIRTWPGYCSINPVERCADPIQPKKAVLSDGGKSLYEPGDTVTFSCIPGTNLSSGELTRECQIDGSWSGATPVCLGMPCPNPVPASNGHISSTGPFTVGDEVTLACNTGYNKTGSDTILCQIGGTWSQANITCLDIDECAKSPCPAKAICTNTAGSYDCACIAGYQMRGSLCEDVDECSSSQLNNCHQYSTCTNSEGSYACSCNAGFQGNGTDCEDIDECASSPCTANAVCTNTAGSYSCACSTGYQMIGSLCEDIEECADGFDDCDMDATCTNTKGSYICQCNHGYTGTGVSCTDIDECTMNLNDCHDNATCNNAEGGYSCACNSNFLGNGTFCEADICPEPITLPSNAVVSSRAPPYGVGEPVILACVNGYTPSGNDAITCQDDGTWSTAGLVCNDTDECADNIHDCHSHATCHNQEAGFSCTCNIGYSGNGTTCQDVDECSNVTDPCHEYATCTNTRGSYKCSCTLGYTGSGFFCSDINECSEGTDNCHGHATCTNVDGSFTCACHSGFTGNGTYCIEVTCLPPESIPYGNVVGNIGAKYSVGDTVNYECSSFHHHISTPAFAKCLKSGNWSTLPFCIRMGFSCDFEGDLCGDFLAQSTNDERDWAFLSCSPTPTPNTGPDYPSSGDSFLYFESSTPATGRDSAVLETTEPFAVIFDMCLRFSLSMIGSTMGSFTVLADSTVLLRREENLANKKDWTTEVVTVPKGTNKLYFVATRGAGYRSDIAIDNLVIKGQACIPDPCDQRPCQHVQYRNYTTTNGSCHCACPRNLKGSTCDQIDFGDSNPVTTDFELCTDNPLGIFYQLNETVDSFDWILAKGGSDSPYTGPSAPAQGTSYIYCDGSYPNRPSSTGALESALMTGSVRLQYNYHMFGKNEGTLEVYRSDKDLGTSSLLRSYKGQHCPTANIQSQCPWGYDSIDVLGTTYTIVFVCTLGSINDFRTDIAIDNVVITNLG